MKKLTAHTIYLISSLFEVFEKEIVKHQKDYYESI